MLDLFRKFIHRNINNPKSTKTLKYKHSENRKPATTYIISNENHLETSSDIKPISFRHVGELIERSPKNLYEHFFCTLILCGTSWEGFNRASEVDLHSYGGGHSGEWSERKWWRRRDLEICCARQRRWTGKFWNDFGRTLYSQNHTSIFQILQWRTMIPCFHFFSIFVPKIVLHFNSIKYDHSLFYFTIVRWLAINLSYFVILVYPISHSKSHILHFTINSKYVSYSISSLQSCFIIKLI